MHLTAFLVWPCCSLKALSELHFLHPVDLTSLQGGVLSDLAG